MIEFTWEFLPPLPSHTNTLLHLCFLFMFHIFLFYDSLGIILHNRTNLYKFLAFENYIFFVVEEGVITF